MKFTLITSFAVAALVNNTIAIRSLGDVSDLFNDDSEEMETQRSLRETEKEMGSKLGNSLG